MFRFALKNMAIKRVQIILIVLSIVISAGVGVLAYNVSSQVSDGITSNAGYYGVIVGPAGSATQLAMNTMYFTDSPLGTIPYSVVSDLQADSRVQTDENGSTFSSVIPFAIADNYNGSSVIGTTTSYLDGKAIAEGTLFDNAGKFEVVVGATVAEINNLKIGDTIYTSHSSGETHKQGLTVVGILAESHSVFDNAVFTELKTIWEVHEEEEEEGEEHEEHEHEEMHNMVCAILVKVKNPSYASSIATEYDGKIYTDADGDNFTLSAIEPMAVMRSVLEDTNNTKYIVFVLCAIIIVMNIMIISIITLLNMYHSAKEISLMRLIGISMKRINLLYIIQNSLIGLVSTLLAFGVSRLCLLFMKDYVATMGVVLNFGAMYPLEWAILGGIFLISVLPTVVCTAWMSRQDGITD